MLVKIQLVEHLRAEIALRTEIQTMVEGDEGTPLKSAGRNLSLPIFMLESGLVERIDDLH